MSNTLIVSARLEKAAKELKDNMTILKGCSPEVKEVIAMAAKQKCLTYWNDNGYKEVPYLEVGGDRHRYAYCLPDDIEIVVEDEKSAVPAWVAKKYTVCEVQNQEDERFKVAYPNGYWHNCVGLPAALRCKGWVFSGWLHEGCTSIYDVPFGWVGSQGNMQTELADCDRYTTSTAYASVWQKEGEK